MEQVKNKKVWIWLVAGLIVISLIGAVSQTEEGTGDDVETTTVQSESSGSVESTILSEDDYIGREGLVVYSELKSDGFEVEAVFDNEALSEVNGDANELFASLDIDSEEDRESVDAFIVKSLKQNGESIELVVGLR